MKGWIGVDLDGTLAEYDVWRGADHIGAPIPKMVERVKALLAAGEEVRIFTARVSTYDHAPETEVTAVIQAWCFEHLGRVLSVTCQKDYGMIACYDDRCKQVLPNSGVLVEDQLAELRELEEFRDTHDAGFSYVQYLVDGGFIHLDEDGCFTFPDGTIFQRKQKTVPEPVPA